jgi:pimeloyl-ACP methyl ester carboxylesterase
VGTVTSKDGTSIAYDKRGSGPAVILVDPALGYRSFSSMDHLAELLAPHFTVYNYDRRGRGESGNSPVYSIEREIEDLDALINEAGGKASLFGTSSGACLALETAYKLGKKVKKLAMYEPAYITEKEAPEAWKEYRKELDRLLGAGQKGDAVVHFMRFVGTPAEMINGMRQSPGWPMFEALAPTLAYDAAVIGDNQSIPAERAAKVTCPVLVMNGTVTPFIPQATEQLAKALPHSQHRVLEGQSHDVNLELLTTVLTPFFED